MHDYLKLEVGDKNQNWKKNKNKNELFPATS